MYYHAIAFPFGPLFVIIISIFIVICSNLDSMREGEWGTVLISYMSVLVFAILYIVFKIAKKTEIVPYKTMFEGIEIHRKPEDDGSHSGSLGRDPLIGSEPKEIAPAGL
jgi:lysine-specific permease